MYLISIFLPTPTPSTRTPLGVRPRCLEKTQMYLVLPQFVMNQNETKGKTMVLCTGWGYRSVHIL